MLAIKEEGAKSAESNSDLHFVAPGRGSSLFDESLAVLAERLNSVVRETVDTSARRLGFLLTERGLVPVWKVVATHAEYVEHYADRAEVDDLGSLDDAELLGFLDLA